MDLNHRPSAYEADELTTATTPQDYFVLKNIEFGWIIFFNTTVQL